MADKIHINHGKVEEDAMQIESAAAYFANIPLAPMDVRTTLPVNAKSKDAYGRSQERIVELGRLLDQEVKNIRELQVAFVEFDEMTGKLAENGSRYPVLEAAAKD